MRRIPEEKLRESLNIALSYYSTIFRKKDHFNAFKTFCMRNVRKCSLEELNFEAIKRFCKNGAVVIVNDLPVLFFSKGRKGLIVIPGRRVGVRIALDFEERKFCVSGYTRKMARREVKQAILSELISKGFSSGTVKGFRNIGPILKLHIYPDELEPYEGEFMKAELRELPSYLPVFVCKDPKSFLQREKIINACKKGMIVLFNEVPVVFERVEGKGYRIRFPTLRTVIRIKWREVSVEGRSQGLVRDFLNVL